MKKKAKKSLPKKKRPAPKPKIPKRSLRGGLYLGEELDRVPSVTALRAELQEMKSVLMGRKDPPIYEGVHTLQEVADGYFARAAEMTMHIQQLETDKVVGKGDVLYKFRTGELRTFMDLAKKADELGSRRLTRAQMKAEASRYGRESRGGLA